MDSKTLQAIAIFTVGIALLALFLWYFGTESDRRKRMVGTILAVLVTGFCIFAYFNQGLLLGQDLKGGSSFVVRIMPSKERIVDDSSLEEAKKVFRKRLDQFGGNLAITKVGDDRLELQMPGINDEQIEGIENSIKKVAKLEFRMVHPNNDAELAKKIGDETLIVPGFQEMQFSDEAREDDDEEAKEESILVNNTIDVSGKHVSNAYPFFGGEGWTVGIDLDGEGAERMLAATTGQRGRRLAVIIDGKVFTAPRIQTDGGLGSGFIIQGNFSTDYARQLSSVLSNPLENPVEVLSRNRISASYGEKTIRQGVMAGLVGLGLTLLFMVIYYRVAGIIALIGLTISVVMLFGAMAVFQLSMTMPGIAGVLLTIGIAVDANVLIYERLREEMKAGKSLGAAIRAAYEKAFSAIFDANVTTLITAVILFTVASGTIKGFAVTLTVGILGTLFASLLVTRVCFGWASGLKTLSFLQLIPERLIDFMSKRKIAMIVSLSLIAISILTMIFKGGDSLGYDLKGGEKIELVGQAITQEQIRTAVDGLAIHVAEDGTYNTEGNGKPIEYALDIQEQTPLGDDPFLVLRTDFNCGKPIIDKLEASLNIKIPQDNVQTIGPQIGKELLQSSLLALGLGLLGILIYLSIRFEFSFALGAIVALFHDLIIAIGVVILTGHEISLILVGAFLTIAGYSINDTIVVFDRIRETLRHKQGKVVDAMNLAISTTLGRTILTSLTTLLTTGCLYLFGGPSLREFSFAIIIGVLIGTYSSIFVASPVVLWWSEKRNKNLRREILDADQAKIVDTSGIEREVPMAPEPESK